MSSSNKKVVTFRTEKKSSSGGGILKYIGLALVALAVFGLVFLSVFSGGGPPGARLIFGKYGDKVIIYRYNNSFGRAVENEMAKYSNAEDSQISSFVHRLAWREAFSSVVVNSAVNYQLDHSGYDVSPRAVDRRIVEYGPYRSNGQFDEDLYRSASVDRKALVRDLFEEQILMETWSQDVLEAPFRSDAQLDFLEKMKLTTRTYDYVKIPFSEFPDEKILDYAKANSQLFRRMPISRIAVRDEETAKEVVTAYEAQKQDIGAFAALANEYSEDGYKDEGGSMGPTDYYSLTEMIGEENADAVFALQEREIIGPLDTNFGWMILRSDGITESMNPDERIEDVRDYMLDNEVGLIEDTILAQADLLRQQALKGDSFREAMEDNGQEVLTTSAFPINFGGDSLLGGSPENSNDQFLGGTASSTEFWSKVVPLEEIGAISEPVVLNEIVVLFSLASIEEEEKLDYWDIIIEGETARSRQDDFRTSALNEELGLFKDTFNKAYSRLFPVQG